MGLILQLRIKTLHQAKHMKQHNPARTNFLLLCGGGKRALHPAALSKKFSPNKTNFLMVAVFTIQRGKRIMMCVLSLLK